MQRARLVTSRNLAISIAVLAVKDGPVSSFPTLEAPFWFCHAQ
jgi:hypothetical protein